MLTGEGRIIIAPPQPGAQPCAYNERTTWHDPEMAAEPHAIPDAARCGGKAQRANAWHWRLVATGLCFVLFGLGAILVGTMWIPLATRLAGRRGDPRMRARAAIRRGMRCFVEAMRVLGVLTYEVRGVERLGRPGQLVLANHPSLIDAVFLLAFVPNAACIVKQALCRHPVTRAAVRAAGFIGNEPTAEMIERAAAALAAGECLIMFPEGTRSVPDAPLAFQRGAANIALRAAAVVTPVYIRCAPTTLTKAEPWYRIPPRRVRFSLEVGEDIDPRPHREGAGGGVLPLPIASRAFNAHLRERFRQALGPPVAPLC